MSDTPATPEPPWLTAQPLPVPSKAREVDLAKSFGRLLIRASALRQRRAEDAHEARGRERQLLMTLIETDDDLMALQRGRSLAPGRASGVDAVRRRLHRRLAAFGVKEIELEGRAVNTAYAEVAGTQETDAVAPDTVVETMAACFLWEGEVLRPARVFVAVPTAAPPAGADVPIRGEPDEPWAAAPADGGVEPADGGPDGPGDVGVAGDNGDTPEPSDLAAGTAAAPAAPPDSGAPHARPDDTAENRPRRTNAKRDQPKRTTRANRKATEKQARKPGSRATHNGKPGQPR